MMKRYPEYKESGVEWIGEIPKHWETKAIWMMFHLGRGRVISNEEIGVNPGQYPVYSSQTENEGIMGYIDTYDFDGDYITWTTDGAKAGTVFYRSGQFNCTNVCGTLSPRNQDLDLRFFRDALNVVTSRFVRYDINPKLMNNVMAKIRVQVPSETEQTQIANFLDRKTEQIDELIRIKERRIELLQEQRTALINQAVTKGLDPNMEMKPSEVEWIGEIPKHWTLTRLKYISNIPVTYGLNIEADRYTTEGIRLIRITDIAEGGSLTQNGVYLPQDCVPQEQMLNSYDLLLSRSGATVGKSYLHLETGKYTSAGYLVRFNFDDYWTSKFIYYVTLSHFYRNWLEQQVIISTIQNVNGEKYSNFQIPIPLPQEQKQIVNFLDHKTQQIDELITTEQRKIELLKEYRQSLISEAVTGKIDVRNEI